MRILCDKDEFALLVRECQLCESKRDCVGCLFVGTCGKGVDMNCIEDICYFEEEVSLGDG